MSSLSRTYRAGVPGTGARGGAARPGTSPYPAQHRAIWLTGWCVLAAWIVVSLVFLPGLVNSAAYLTGLSPSARFVPVSYAQACSKGICRTITEGRLEPGGARTTWDSQVPLGRPFTVRVPVWAWGTGRHLIDSTGTAVGELAFSLIFDGATALGLAAAGTLTLRAVRQRREGLVPAPVSRQV